MSVETYSFPQHLTIRTISDQHHHLKDKIDSCQTLAAEVPIDAEIDISFLQLMESARLYASSTGKMFGMLQPAEGTLLDALMRCGWLSADNAEIRRFWLHEGAPQ
jgi:hypothetical protein